MGQSVSVGGSVLSHSLRGHRQYFVEHIDTFVPLVRTSFVYDFSVNVTQPSLLQIFTLQDELVQELVVTPAADGRCAISACDVQVPAATFYRIRLFAMSVVVFLEDDSAKNAVPEFSNDIQSWLPDSVDFRQLVASMETDLQFFQRLSVWKGLQESVMKVQDCLVQLSQLLNNITRLSLPTLSHPNLLIQLINTGFLDGIHTFRRNQVDPFSKGLLNNVITPLHEFMTYVNQNQKALAKNQKNFHDLTKSFYVNPSQSNSPLHLKKEFELSRLDYYDFLYQSLFNGLPLRKFASSISLFLYKKRVNESDFNLSYIPKMNSLRSSIRKSKNLNELASMYSNFKNCSNFKEDVILIRYLKHNDNSIDTSNSNESNNASSSATNHWHRQWVMLNDHILQLYSTSKKLQSNSSSPFHQINLSFACIKLVNSKILEVITTGSPITMSAPISTPTTTSASATTPATRTAANDDIGSPVRFLLQLSSESEMRSWLTALKQQPTLETDDLSTSITKDSSSSLKHETNTLLDIVKSQHESNLICCDCSNTESVEWISINLLCVVCIKCSGVHRSMGSHISKMRSLTLDNFTSPEIIQLIHNNISNSNVNSIYESSSTLKEKISSSSNDAERSRYIIDKYQSKKFVDDGNQDAKKSFKALIKAIHLNSVYLIQKCIAQSRISLKEIIDEETNKNEGEQPPSIFQYSLKHHEMISGHPIFLITEFLLLNGIPIDKLPTNTSTWAPSVINYWKSKLEIYETYKPISLGKQKDEKVPLKPASSKSQLPALSIPSDRSTKRWSLNPIPSSAQLKSPTNLLTMHKSLKLTKRGANSHKE